MENMIKKSLITMYDPSIKEAPFLTLPLDTMEIVEPVEDDYGELLATRLICGCISKGYKLNSIIRLLEKV